MSIFYMDYDNGIDSTTNTPLGWWSVAYTNGSVLAPIANEVVTGTSSSATAKVTVVVAPTSGSWTAGSAAGTMYFYGKSGTFQNEIVSCAGGGSFSITADFTYCAWKTMTTGATLARIDPGDIVRVAKSGSPTSIGTATWTSLSKTVALGTVQTLNIELCNNAWTSASGTSASTPVATDAKEGSWCMKITENAAPAVNDIQAYRNTGSLVLSSYQKISFWIKNEVAILTGQWEINLCSDTSGSVPIDTFLIPAIPSTARWLPLTLARDGGGNLGSSTINSINISNGSATYPTASKYIYVDDIIACTTSGLNLQSLISQNSLEQGGTEGWLGIQSIDGSNVLLDLDTNTLANAGRGYSGTSGSPITYIRETIKTAMAAVASTVVQEVMDSGTAGINIQFQGGYNTSTNEQTGETFFDGLNGNGYGIQLSSKFYITLNYFNVVRYNNGIYLSISSNNTFTTVSNANNNNNYGIYLGNSSNNTFTTVSNANNNNYYGIYLGNGSNNTFTTVSNANNNNYYGIYLGGGSNNTFTTVSNANNNNNYGIYLISSSNNTFTTVSNANNNNYYGIYLGSSSDNTFTTIFTIGNAVSSISPSSGWNYIKTATLTESSKASGFTNYADGRIFIESIGGFCNIWCEYGNIVSQNATAGGTGIEWRMNITNVLRNSIYPLKLKLAEFATAANTEVTITCYFKKSQNADIYAALVIPGGQIGGGVTNVVTPCPDNTSRNQLQVKFTPSVAGVFIVEAWAYWLANTADENVIIDDIAISQV